MNVQEARDWVDSLHANCSSKNDLWVYTGDAELEPGDTVSLRYIERESSVFLDYTKSDVLFEMPYCVHGDYIGSLVEMANFNVLTSEEFLEGNDLPAHVIGIGGFGSKALYYSLCTATQTQLDNLKEIVEDLDGYPVIDDDAWTTLEMEVEEADIDDWLWWNVARELRSAERDDVEEWAEEDHFQILLDIIDENEVEMWVEGIGDVCYSKDSDWFAQKVIEKFEEV